MTSTVRTNDPDGMRRKIVDAAFIAFTREGYNATSMHRLREDAAVSGGAFSHHFPTKRALGLAVIRDRVAEAIEESWIKPVLSAPDVVTGIGSVFRSVIEEIEKNKAVTGCPLGNLAVELSMQDPDLRAEMQSLYNHWRDAISRELASERPIGSGSQAEADATATLLIAAFTGGIAMAKASQSAEPLRQTWAEIFRLLRAQIER